MKVKDLTEAKRAPTDKGYYTPGYDEEAKRVVGHVNDWMARLGASKEDIAAAVDKAKSLPSYAKLKEMEFVDKSSAGERKNGTFAFLKPHRQSDDQKYLVYANGLIRSSVADRWGGGAKPTRLTGPKPRLVAGNPIESLVKIYDGAFKELALKVEKIKKKVNEASEKLVPKFRISWSGYPGNPKPEVHDRDYFDDDMGFDEENQEEIDGLGVGEECSFGGPFDSVTIERLADGKPEKAKVAESAGSKYIMTVSRRDHASNTRDMSDESIDRLKTTFMTNTEKAAVKRMGVGDDVNFTHMDGETRVKVNVKRVK